MSGSTTVEGAPSNCDNTSCYYILETKKGFHSIGSWRARFIQWLHLERWFGTVYRADVAGLGSLERRVEALAQKVLENQRELQKEKFQTFVSLSQALHTIRRKGNNALIYKVHQSVQDKVKTLFISYIAHEKERVEKEWSLKYATIVAEQFIEECSAADRDNWRALCEKKCRALKETCPAQERALFKAFFSRAKDSPYSKGVKPVESAYRRRWEITDYFKGVQETTQNFFLANRSPTSLEIARWLKNIVKDIEKEAPEEASLLYSRLMSLIRKNLRPWQLKEALRGYGSLMGESCKKPLNTSFEKAAEFLRKVFPEEKEFSSAMEGLIEKKGKEYCRVVAQAIQPEENGPFLEAYVEQARTRYSTMALHIVRGVLKEILLEHKHSPSDSLCDCLALVFVHMYQDRREPDDFSIFNPIFGSGLSALKASSQGRALSVTGLGENSRREEAIWPEAFQGIEVSSLDAKSLQKIEQKIVTMMISDSGKVAFCTYYGSILGRRIKECARTHSDKPYNVSIDEGYKSYEGFLTQNFSQHKELILEATRKVLTADTLSQLEALVSVRSSWEEPGAFDEISNRLRREPIDFCPALERVAHTIVLRFVEACCEFKGKFLLRPPLYFFYTKIPTFHQSIQAVVHALGLQGNGKEYFIELLKKHEKGPEIIQWIQNGISFYTKEKYKQSFTIPAKVPKHDETTWRSENSQESMLLSSWIPFFLDAEAIDKSIFRSGLSSIAVEGNTVTIPEVCATNISKSCALADILLKRVPQQEKVYALKSYKSAIGKLLTFAAIDYDPGSIIPCTLSTFPYDLGIKSHSVYIIGGDSGVKPPITEKYVYRFGYSEKKFYVERDFCYRDISGQGSTGWWHVTSRQEIDPLKPEEIVVVLTSDQIQGSKGK